MSYLYDPLKHYIMEGLIVIFSFIDEDSNLRGQYYAASGVTIDTAMGEIKIKHGQIWYTYALDAEFYKEYSIRADNEYVAVAAGLQWRHRLNKIFQEAHLEQLA